jgi:hypothetical protein
MTQEVNRSSNQGQKICVLEVQKAFKFLSLNPFNELHVSVIQPLIQLGMLINIHCLPL